MQYVDEEVRERLGPDSDATGHRGLNLGAAGVLCSL